MRGVSFRQRPCIAHIRELLYMFDNDGSDDDYHRNCYPFSLLIGWSGNVRACLRSI
ncbi:unnamed protein product [Periconia digitata]|uniref:Uncharacterized protein n=1 Tax=Periconia digitata TaxID=1303443 RepID=A0A9W4UJP5_9PLEO|nr:unnamed protein product [Periconia digitata]